jgi:hypothetical protein
MVETLDEYCKRTEQEKKELNQKISGLTGRLQAREAGIEGFKSENEGLLKDVANLNQAISSLYDAIDVLKKSNEIYANDLCNERQKVIAMRGEIRDLKERLTPRDELYRKDAPKDGVEFVITRFFYPGDSLQYFMKEHKGNTCWSSNGDLACVFETQEDAIKIIRFGGMRDVLVSWRQKAQSKTCDTCRFYPAIKKSGCPIECMMCREKSLWEPISK